MLAFAPSLLVLTPSLWWQSVEDREIGSAREWRDEYLETVEHGKPQHKMLEDFFNTIKEEFGDPDKQATKIYKLRTITQGDHTADEHVLAFRKAARSSGYGGEALIEEFKRSLNSRLRERVSNLDNVPETIDGWYRQAMRLDRQWRRAKQEADYYNRMTNNARTTQPRNNAGQYDSKPATPAAPAKDPNAMDVDRQRR